MTFWSALHKGAFIAAAFLTASSFIFWPLILTFVFPGAWMVLLPVFVFWLALIGRIFDVEMTDQR